MRLSYFGSGRLGLDCLEALLSNGQDVVSATTEYYNMDDITPQQYAGMCFRNEIPFYHTDMLKYQITRYKSYFPDLNVFINWPREIPIEMLHTSFGGYLYSLPCPHIISSDIEWNIVYRDSSGFKTDLKTLNLEITDETGVMKLYQDIRDATIDGLLEILIQFETPGGE